MPDDDGQDWMEFLDIICEKKYAGLSYNTYMILIIIILFILMIQNQKHLKLFLLQILDCVDRSSWCEKGLKKHRRLGKKWCARKAWISGDFTRNGEISAYSCRKTCNTCY